MMRALKLQVCAVIAVVTSVAVGSITREGIDKDMLSIK
jgi:hypothetical protein